MAYRKQSRKREERLTSGDIRLFLCICIFFCSVLLKYADFGVFPAIRHSLSEALTNGASAREVVAVVGRAIGGDGLDEIFSSEAVEAFSGGLIPAKAKGRAMGSETPEIDPDGEEPDPTSTYQDVFSQPHAAPTRSPLTIGGTGVKKAQMGQAIGAGEEEEPLFLLPESATPEELKYHAPAQQKNKNGKEPPDKVDLTDYAMVFSHQNPVKAAITSPFGYRDHPIDGEYKFHYGYDLGAVTGTEIYAFADGKVTAAGTNNIYGNYFIVTHQDGFSSFYGHCSKLLIKEGQEVKKGEKIALVGATGKVTGSHLHFEIRRNGKILDPGYYVSYS